MSSHASGMCMKNEVKASEDSLQFMLAKTHESDTCSRLAVCGQWHGLLQISPATARGYGCNAGTAGALKDGGANLSCGLRIMAVTVPRDGVISAGMRGVAADWGPFHQASKRADIQAITRNSSVCRL